MEELAALDEAVDNLIEREFTVSNERLLGTTESNLLKSPGSREQRSTRPLGCCQPFTDGAGAPTGTHHRVNHDRGDNRDGDG